MKQRAQFKLTGIAGIAGKRYEAQKNRRQLLRGMGVNLAVTPTPDQQPTKKAAADLYDKFAREWGAAPRIRKDALKDLRFYAMYGGNAALRWDGARLRVVAETHRERPNGVPEAAVWKDGRMRWVLYGGMSNTDVVDAWDAVGNALYPHRYYDWGTKPDYSEWKPDCRKASDMHYNALAGDARKNRNTIEPERVARMAENFARVIETFANARAELLHTHAETLPAGVDTTRSRYYENWTGTDKRRGTDPMLINAEDADDQSLKAHPYYLGHVFTDATGWYLLGSGAYSYAFANDAYPGLVIKLGKKYDDACFNYLEWAQGNQNLHGVPSVYFLKRYAMDASNAGFYVAVMDYLEYNPNATYKLGLLSWSDKREWEYSIPKDASPIRAAVHETLQLIWETEQGSPDLHGGNILFDKNGDPVISDPFC